ncbi:hypothetical protein AB6A40_005605 [Gnathostoma spinigerum]|uniref:Amine oxidase domain-containing protein n=1 Tax=Gnathostoma spinigerum TaxID=75299 RepID=A0ABD6EN86_9BILA
MWYEILVKFTDNLLFLKVLFFWLSRDGPQQIGQMCDVELSERITKYLRIMFQNESIPQPTKILRKQWNLDELFLGSYSYITPASAMLGDPQEILASPIEQNGHPKVLFAGEATHSRIYQTVTGAYLSGQREADRINAAYKNRNKPN